MKACSLLGGPIPPSLDSEAPMLPPTNEGMHISMLLQHPSSLRWSMSLSTHKVK